MKTIFLLEVIPWIDIWTKFGVFEKEIAAWFNVANFYQDIRMAVIKDYHPTIGAYSSLLPLRCKVGGEVLKERGRSIHGHASDAVIHKLLWKNVGCLFLPTISYCCHCCCWFCAHDFRVRSMAVIYFFPHALAIRIIFSKFSKKPFDSGTVIFVPPIIWYLVISLWRSGDPVSSLQPSTEAWPVP